ncbi:MAG: hypothetical protein ABIA74_02670 [bacterium]
MIINKKIFTSMFLSLFLLGTFKSVLPAEQSIEIKPVEFELNLGELKLNQTNSTNIPVWEVVGESKKVIDKKIEKAEDIVLYSEITSFLEKAVAIEQFLEIFVPRFIKELQSEGFSNNSLTIIDQAINEKVSLEDILLLKKFSKKKLLFKKLSYASTNIVLYWIYDFIIYILESEKNLNPIKVNRINKYIKILDLLLERTANKTSHICNVTKEAKVSKEKIINLLDKLKFEKIIVTPIAEKTIKLIVNQKNIAGKIIFNSFMKNSKTKELIASMMIVAVEIFSRTFGETEVNELINFCNSDLFHKLTTIKNKQSNDIALLHILKNLGQQAQDFYKNKVKEETF